MKYRRLLAGAAALVMIASFTSCGKDEKSEAIENPVVTETEEATFAPDEDEAEAEKNNSKNDEKKPSKTTSAKDGKDKGKEKSTTTAAKSTDKNSSGSKGGSEKNDGGSEPSDSKSENKTDSGSAGKKEPAKTTSAKKPSEQQSSTEAETSEKTFDGEASFSGGASVSGSNISADGSVVRITAGGDYRIKGNTGNGQIVVDTATEEKVEITLDGVDITCSDGPAVFIKEAKKCILKIADGSTNYLRDGGKDKVNDGVIFTNDTLRIKGGGRLEINAENAHGIASDDDIIIESGTFLINSIKSGIIAHDDVTVNGGELTIFGGTNGIKSKGTVHINGGTSWICGGVKEEKSSVYAASQLIYTGGSVYAAGNMVTAPAESANPYIVVNWKNGADAGSTVSLLLGGNEYASLTPKNPYKCVLMLSPDIAEGDGFTPVMNGEGQGDFTVSGRQNVFVIE